jgi:GTP-binding protein YchF
MKIGLFGFPLTGKSTLFRLLTGSDGSSPGAHGETQVGIAKVPDPRVARLVAMYKPKKTTPATVEYLDIAGVEKGQAAKALPLDQLRTVDALAHVVRGFEDDALPHSEGEVDPARDVATMETEFIIADLGIAERRREKLELTIRKTNRDEDKQELATINRCIENLEAEVPLRNVEFDERELQRLRGFTFLSLKPLLVVINTGEDHASELGLGPEAFGLGEVAEMPMTEVVALSAKLEGEIAQLDGDDAAQFMEELGISEPALDRVIRASYHLLGRHSFFTVGEDEVRAWTIRVGTPARKAAAAIHSDIERGFIRAELVAYDDLIDAGAWNVCRDRGTLRLEGKDYVVRNGDVINFRFNV